MTDLFIPAVSAFWLGLMTSISPCPLATNILAVSFIDRSVARPRTVVLSGLLYTLGRMVTYVALGILIVSSILSVPQVSYLLQKYMNKVLGPILIFVGMILLELIRFNFSRRGISTGMQKRLQGAGIWGAGLLGIIFALSFCPVSAALFFGSLIPLSVKYESHFVLPALYGLGTGLPVFLFAVLIALGAESVGKVFSGLTRIEWWFRRATGGIFVIIGIYYCLAYIFGVFR